MNVMTSSAGVPQPLIELGREAAEAVASTGDMTTFRGLALRNEARDALFKPLLSYEKAKDVICAVPLAAERYGPKDVAGDRLTLQFIYQLFPWTSGRGVGVACGIIEGVIRLPGGVEPAPA